MVPPQIPYSSYRPTFRHLSRTGHSMQISLAVSIAAFFRRGSPACPKSSGKKISGTFSHATPPISVIASCRSRVMRLRRSLSVVIPKL